jgi:hypothetical protein
MVFSFVPGVCFFLFCTPHNSSCIKQSLRIMSTPVDRTQEPNMEGQETVAPMVAPPHLDDNKVEDDPVVAPVVSRLSAIGLEHGAEENPGVASVVAPPPRQAIPAQQINPKVLMWTAAKPLSVLYPTLEEYRKVNKQMIRDQENRNRDDEEYEEFHRQMFGDRDRDE